MKISLKAHGMVWLLRTQGSLTLREILEQCTDGRDAVKAALQELKTLELVSMSKIRASGRFEEFTYSLTSSGKSVNGGRLENTGFLAKDIPPLTENPSMVRPVTENPSMVEVTENELFAPTSSGKSVNGGEINDYIYLSNKGKYNSNNNTTLNTSTYIGEKVENFENESPASIPAPKRQKRELKPKVLFRETEFVKLVDGPERFKRALIARNPVYELADLDYYYTSVLNWSDSGDNRKIDWIATAANFILGDEKKGGYKKAKTNSIHNGSSKGFNTITRADIERAERLVARFGWES